MRNDLLIVDAHVHTFQTEEIGRQALAGLGYGYAGTPEELAGIMDAGKISAAVTANLLPLREMKQASVAKLPSGLPPGERDRAVTAIDNKMIERLVRRNRWTCEVAAKDPRFVPLISADLLQGPAGMAAEVEERVAREGAKGVKLHPIANAYYPWDERLWPLYSRAQQMGVPILFHSGASDLPGYDSRYGHPREFAKVAQSFPRLTLVLAHLGRGFFEESVRLAAEYANVFFDTSGCLFPHGVAPQMGEVEKLIRRIGADRVMFGSDWPWFDPLRDIAALRQSGLSAEEKAQVLGLNAKSIFQL